MAPVNGMGTSGVLRIGIVGCGFIGRVHSFALWALRDVGEVDGVVVSVFDHDLERANAVASVHGAEVAPDVDTLIDAVDVVWVCTPTSSHREVAAAAAAAGRAVMCEKPLGRDLAEAAAVGAALSDVPHRVGLVLRCAPVFRALAAEVATGRHGRPMAAVFRDDQSFPLGGMYGSTWRADAETAGAGTLIEHSIHDVDVLRWLLGDARTVSARTANFAGHQDIEDLAVATITFEGGAVASLTSVWHGVMSRPSTRRLELFCEDALLWLEDDNTGPLHVETSSGAAAIECPTPDWAAAFRVPDEHRAALALYAAAAKGFLDDLAAGAAGGPPGASEAVAAHRVVDAAYRSAGAGGTPVDVATDVP